MHSLIPEPDLPLRDRLVRLQHAVPRADLQRWAAGLATGAIAADSPEHPRIEWLGGTPGWASYWARTWGLRLLLHAGVDDEAVSAVVAALHDDAWRPREMALKVIARHALQLEPETIVAMLDDPVPRVRAHAARVLDLRNP